MVGPNFDRESAPDAAVREGMDELTLRRGVESTQRSFFNTTNVEACRPGPLLVDEDQHAVCQSPPTGASRL